MSLIPGFLKQLEGNSSKTAFVIDGCSCSYHSLAERALLARDFLQLQASESRRSSSQPLTEPLLVELCELNSIEFAVWYLACVSAGHVLVLLDPGLPEERRQASTLALPPLIRSFSTASSARSVDSAQVSETNPASSPCTLLNAVSLTDRFSAADLGASAFLIGFTSGSSAAPKAFVRTQNSWVHSFRASAVEFGSHAGQNVLAPGPLSHGLSFFAMAEVLFQGSTFHSMVKFDAQHCLALIEDRAIDTLIVVPTMLELIVCCLETKARQKPCQLRRIISAGAKLAPALAHRVHLQLPDVRLSEYFGASELSFVSVSHDVEAPPADSVGRAFSGVGIQIASLSADNPDPANPDSITQVPARSAQLGAGENQAGQIQAGQIQVGEIQVLSEMLADGYIKEGDQSGNFTVQPLPGSKTHKGVGDIGYIDQSGYLFLKERFDRMVTVGGLNVFPSAIESVILAMPGIVQAAVVNLDDKRFGALIVAVVCLQPGCSMNVGELLKGCGQVLQKHELPRSLWRMDALPLTHSGKVSYAMLTQSVQSSTIGNEFELLAQEGLRLQDLPLLGSVKP